MPSRRLALLSLTLTTMTACGGGGDDSPAAPPAPTPPAPTPPAPTPPAPTPPAPTPPAPTPPAPTPPPMPAGWTRLADMPVGLAKFGVAASGGKLYVAGGYDTLRSVLVYDIASDRWESGSPMLQGSDNLVVLEGAGRVHAIGGEARTAVQVLNPATGQWSSGPASPAIRFASAGAALNGRLHLIGGWNYSNTASNSVATHGIFDLATQAWSVGAPLLTARNAAAAAVIGSSIYVVGGRSPGIRANDQSPLASVEIYSPASNSWSAGVALPAARASLAVLSLGGRLYAMGGELASGQVSDAVERFDPSTNLWTALPAMPLKVHGFGAVVVDSSIYVMGGFTGPSDAVGSESRALYRYTPSTS